LEEASREMPRGSDTRDGSRAVNWLIGGLATVAFGLASFFTSHLATDVENIQANMGTVLQRMAAMDQEVMELKTEIHRLQDFVDPAPSSSERRQR
jgi:cell division protein FtsB